MKKLIRNHIISAYLLAIFFIVHGYTEYREFIGLGNCLLLAFLYLSLVFISFTIWKYFFKDSCKASLLNILLFAVFFFFSAFHSFMSGTFPNQIISKYSVLLPIVLISILVFIIYLKRSGKNFHRIFQYINICLILFIFWDLIQYGISSSYIKSNTTKEKSEIDPYQPLKHKPSIYLLVFDEYTSSSQLQKTFGYKNKLDSILSKDGFHIFNHSHSNYNFTTFSIASLLSNNYLTIRMDTSRITYKDYLQAEKEIYYNPVGNFLMNQGYDIRNLSMFDWQNHPSLRAFYLFPSGTLLLRKRTFFLYIYEHLGWHFSTLRVPFLNQWEKNIYSTLSYNELVEKELLKAAAETSSKPQFIYAHFMMPHPPFFFKKDGTPRPKEEVLYEAKHHLCPPDKYLDNIDHTNNKIETFVRFIQKKERGNAIIMIVGDHGFRQNDPARETYFSNYNAIYFPSEIRPTHFPEKMSLVNEFRLLFNQCAEEIKPFIDDRQYFLKDADSE